MLEKIENRVSIIYLTIKQTKLEAKSSVQN